MFIEFEKWHGAKNDFLVVWIITSERDTVLESLKRQAKSICSRDGSGVGADGLMVLETTLRQDILPKEMHIINSDGSLAKNCGNGLRCAAMSVKRKHHRKSDDELEGVTLKVQDMSYDCRFVGKNLDKMVAVTMPVPHINLQNSWHLDATGKIQDVLKSRVDDPKAQAFKLLYEPSSVTLGNEHIVLFSEDSSKEICLEIGPKLQTFRGPTFTGINIHFSRPVGLEKDDLKSARIDINDDISELYEVWPWERGAGFTQACGSGASAVAACAYLVDMASRDGWIGIDMPGGRLYARQASDGEHVVLTGPAKLVFDGRLDL